MNREPGRGLALVRIFNGLRESLNGFVLLFNETKKQARQKTRRGRCFWDHQDRFALAFMAMDVAAGLSDTKAAKWAAVLISPGANYRIEWQHTYDDPSGPNGMVSSRPIPVPYDPEKDAKKAMFDRANRLTRKFRALSQIERLWCDMSAQQLRILFLEASHLLAGSRTPFQKRSADHAKLILALQLGWQARPGSRLEGLWLPPSILDGYQKLFTTQLGSIDSK